MQVKIIKHYMCYRVGSILDLEIDDVGRMLIQRGFAEEVKEDEKQGLQEEPQEKKRRGRPKNKSLSNRPLDTKEDN